MAGGKDRGSDFGSNKAGALGKTPKFTESASEEFLYGTKTEVAERLEGGAHNTESSFSQIKPERSSPRGRSLAERAPGFARNGKMGKSEHHSGV